LSSDLVLERLPHRIERLGFELQRLRDLPAVGEVRQFGLAAGVEVVAYRQTRMPYPAAERRGMRVCRAARTRGVFLRPLGDVIVLMPPLSLTEPEITPLVDAIEFGIREICPCPHHPHQRRRPSRGPRSVLPSRTLPRR